MACQSQYDFGIRADFEADSAFSLTALKPRPGGSISPFCDPAMATSTPHSSWRKSMEPSDEMVSTMNSAGCLARSIALRIEGIELVTALDVSLCTTMTALIR